MKRTVAALAALVVLCVPAVAAAKDPALAGFIAECKRHGTAQEVIDKAEKLGFDTGIEAVHVPFQATTQQMLATAGGHLDFTFPWRGTRHDSVKSGVPRSRPTDGSRHCRDR